MPPYIYVHKQTTLLNLLADRVARGRDTLITGDVRFNGGRMSPALKKHFGYVLQVGELALMMCTGLYIVTYEFICAWNANWW